MVQELELWITFGAGARALGSLLVPEPVLWGHFLSRRPCFVGSLFVQAPVLCGVSFLVPVPVRADLSIVVVMPQQDLATRLHF